MTLSEQVEALGPWVTKFTVLGQAYGGSYDALNDDRVSRVVEAFPRPRRVLECGCLEGAHTVILGRAYPGAEIVALDAREANLARARFLTSLYGIRPPTFAREDLETADLSKYEPFDLVVCVGLLYHLWEPWKFLDQVGKRSRGLWLWTVICGEDEVSATEGGYRGRIYREENLAHPLSAVRAQSFFPTLGSLCAMLRAAGFEKLTLTNFEQTPDGPSVSVVAKQEPFR